MQNTYEQIIRLWLEDARYGREDVNGKYKYGIAPLEAAYATGRHWLVSALLKAGANTETLNLRDEPILYTACLKKDSKTVKLLLRHGAAHQSPGLFLAASGHINTTSALIAHGCRPTTGEAIRAIVKGGESLRVEYVTLLIGALPPGVDISSFLGQCVLHLCQNGHFGAIRGLLELGADPNYYREVHYDVGGSSVGLHTPLSQAIFHGDLECATLLLDNGARIGPDSHLAAEHGSLKALAFLLDNGADVEAWIPGDATSALGRVMKSGDLEKAKLLVGRGADRYATYKGSPVQSVNKGPEFQALFNSLAKRAE